MTLDKLLFGVLLGSVLLALAPCVPAVGAEIPSLCLAPVYPRERYVTIKIGYSKDVTSLDFWKSGNTRWVEAVKDRIWQLSVPDDFVIWDRRASDRAEVSTDVTFEFLYPEMLPMIGVDEEMQHLGIAKFGPFKNKAGLPNCERRGPLDPGLGEVARTMSIDLAAPAPCCRMPIDPERRCTSSKIESEQLAPEMDFDGLRACITGGAITGVSYYVTLDNQPFALTCKTLAKTCVASFDLWTWPVHVNFARGLLPKWQTVIGAARAFLESATQSKSDIPSEIK
jgi:hypothetical protein